MFDINSLTEWQTVKIQISVCIGSVYPGSAGQGLIQLYDFFESESMSKFNYVQWLFKISVSILFSSSAVIVQISQTYRKVDVIKELDFFIFLFIPHLFSFAGAAVVCTIPRQNLMMDPRYWNALLIQVWSQSLRYQSRIRLYCLLSILSSLARFSLCRLWRFCRDNQLVF